MPTYRLTRRTRERSVARRAGVVLTLTLGALACSRGATDSSNSTAQSPDTRSPSDGGTLRASTSTAPTSSDVADASTTVPGGNVGNPSDASLPPPGELGGNGSMPTEGCEAAPLEEFCTSLGWTFGESCDNYDDRFSGYDGGASNSLFDVSACQCTDDAGTVFDYAIAASFPKGTRHFYDTGTGELVAAVRFSDVVLSPNCAGRWYGRVIKGCGSWCPNGLQDDIVDAGP